MSTRIPQIISVDDHVVEPAHLWQTWLPQQFRERGPRIERHGHELRNVNGTLVPTRSDTGPKYDWWVFEDIAKTMPVASHFAGRAREEVGIDPLNFADMPVGFYEPKARLAAMDENHTERSMCFPNAVPRFCGQTFYEAKDKELGLACVKAYNDFMIEEWCGDSGGRLIPLCLIPLWDPKLAADEVRRNAARGNRAIAFSELPANLGLPSIHDPGRHWDPVFQACNDTGTVICMHIGSGTKFLNSSPDAPQGVSVALTNLNAMMSLADWLLSGTLIRFPTLKIAYSESQIGWMPFVFERVDQVFLKRSAWSGLDPILTELPSTQIPGRVYGCFFQDDFGLQARHAVGLEQITFETDYPHQDTTWPDTLEYLEKATVDLTDEELDLVVRGNAIRMLDLPVDLPAGRRP